MVQSFIIAPQKTNKVIKKRSISQDQGDNINTAQQMLQEHSVLTNNQKIKNIFTLILKVHIAVGR